METLPIARQNARNANHKRKNKDIDTFSRAIRGCLLLSR